MNSMGKIIDGFEWTYNGPLSFARGRGFGGNGVSRTMFLTPKVEDIPAELFAVKISQSPRPDKAGKPAFKWFSFRLSPEAKFENIVPDGVTIETPLEEVRNLVVSKLSNIPGAQVSLSIKLHGRFTVIHAADDDYYIYNEDNEKWKTPDPDTTGNAPYYVKKDVILTVKLKGATSNGNEYLQSVISSTASGEFDEIFAGRAVAREWNAAESTSTPAPASAPTEGGSVW